MEIPLGKENRSKIPNMSWNRSHYYWQRNHWIKCYYTSILYYRYLLGKTPAIEDNVVINPEVSLVDDCCIGHDVIIGYRAIVTKNYMLPYGIAVGVPAKIIK